MASYGLRGCRTDEAVPHWNTENKGADTMEKTILLLGNPDLYQVCEEVKQEELEQMKSLKKDLRDTLLGFRTRYGAGRAIAAPQIGIFKRVIILDLSQELKDPDAPQEF